MEITATNSITPYFLGWGKFPDVKESVMKYCSSVAIGYIDAYLYHMGDWCWIY
jgi:hypothetical protein